MENNEQTKKNHICPMDQGGHCCECNGCDKVGYGMCMHGGMRRYWRRHFIVMIIGVLLAFWVGMKLGEMKGWMMHDYGYMPMHRGGWTMDGYTSDRGPTGALPAQGVTPPPASTPAGQ